MNTDGNRLFFNWKQAQEVIGIGRNLQYEYREAGVLQWTAVGGNGKKPLVFYTPDQLSDFVTYLREHSRDAARRLKQWRRDRDQRRKKR